MKTKTRKTKTPTPTTVLVERVTPAERELIAKACAELACMDALASKIVDRLDEMADEFDRRGWGRCYLPIGADELMRLGPHDDGFAVESLLEHVARSKMTPAEKRQAKRECARRRSAPDVKAIADRVDELLKTPTVVSAKPKKKRRPA